MKGVHAEQLPSGENVMEQIPIWHLILSLWILALNTQCSVHFLRYVRNPYYKFNYVTKYYNTWPLLGTGYSYDPGYYTPLTDQL